MRPEKVTQEDACSQHAERWRRALGRRRARTEQSSTGVADLQDLEGFPEVEDEEKQGKEEKGQQQRQQQQQQQQPKPKRPLFRLCTTAQKKKFWPKKKKGWKCEVMLTSGMQCPYEVKPCTNWSDKKMRHLRRWHPELAGPLKHRRSTNAPRVKEAFPVEQVQPGENFAWECPMQKCKCGIKKAPITDVKRIAHRQQRHAHALQAHPKEPLRRFDFGTRAEVGSERSEEATARIRTASANALAAKRISQLTAGVAGPHKAFRFIMVPKGCRLHTGKGCEVCCPKDRSYSVVYCADCRRWAHGRKRLGKKDCVQQTKRKWGRVTAEQRLVASTRRRLATTTLPPERRTELEEFLKLLLPPPEANGPATAAGTGSTAVSSHGGV